MAPAPTGLAAKHVDRRPRRGSSLAQVVPVRMKADELEELERMRLLEGVSRSEVMRRALAAREG